MTGATRSTAGAPRSLRLRPEHTPAFVVATATILVLLIIGRSSWIVLLTEALLPLGLVAAAAGWGAWPTRWLGFGQRPAGQQLCLATALGLGLLGIAALILGVAGLLSQPVAWTLMVLGWLAGISRLYIAQQRTQPANPPPSPSFQTIALASVALLPVVVPLAIALFAASLPPGILWAGENRAYDALEYHLQGPREYFEAGRIHFLPHNVYTSFPQQIEMLYLLLMYLAGGPHAAAVSTQILHLLCGLLAVAALAAWTAPGWPRTLSIILAGTVPWLAYLGCLAYVECGMLFFAAVAAGLVLDHYRDDVNCDWRYALTAGLCAGPAGGCKYTGLMFITAALGLAWLATMRGGVRLRARRLGLYIAGALIAFSPWLLRNAAFTGNPVYPFAYKLFGGTAWSAEQDQQWARGHAIPQRRDSLAERAQTTWFELFASPKFGWAVTLLAAVGLVVGRSRATAMLAVWLALLLASWIGLTHMPGRFVVPAIVPLTLLASAAIRPASQRLRTRARIQTSMIVLVALAGGLVNCVTLARLLHAESKWWGRFEIPLQSLAIHGPKVLIRSEVLNFPNIVPPDANLWIIGDASVFYVMPKMHYTVVFSRDRWLTYAETAPAEQAVAWLRTESVSHVVFSWAEIERLRATYGFPAFVTREWAAGLGPAGLRRVDPPEGAADAPVEIYEVKPG